jgi:site-specific DNA-methyltransferase (adenine-specific)
MTYQLLQGDCLELMRGLPSGSVDCVIVDPPYFRVIAEDWDREWKTITDYQSWVERWAAELKRVVSDKGSIYVFGDDKTIAYVQIVLDGWFTLLNSLVWFKTNNLSIKAAANLRTYAPMTERILFYTPQYCSTGWETVKLDVNNFVSLREYFRQYQDAIGLSSKEINEALGHRKAEHAFYWNSTQWDLPTEKVYEELGDKFCTNGFLRREYEDLRREYEDLRRTFNATAKTLDVITGPIIKQADNTDHPTTKPLWLMYRLINDSTNAGDIVLDFCMGSGTTGVACVKTGRNFIGMELDEHYFEIAKKRIEEATMQLPLLEVS